MASTNKTQNLELSQFLGTDKPAWLADYNSDMEKIDNAVGNLSIEVSNIPLIKEELEEQDESLSARIDNVNTKILEMEEVNQQEAQELITLKNNYETMHHEMVITDEKVSKNSADIETLMNGASGTYSTVEREVGTWVDGKAVYERVISLSTLNKSANSNTNVSEYSGTIMSGIDKLIEVNGSLKFDTGFEYMLGAHVNIQNNGGTVSLSPVYAVNIFTGSPNSGDAMYLFRVLATFSQPVSANIILRYTRK